MITLIFAHARNGMIGTDGRLPWHLPADLKRFRALTMGKPMIMGRKTFESFPSPLPGRRHIVLTRDARWQAAGGEVAHSMEHALALAGEDVAVIGGAEVFALFERLADRAEVTVIDREYPGDTVYRLNDADWIEIARVDHPAVDEKPAYSFTTLTHVAIVPGIPTGAG